MARPTRTDPRPADPVPDSGTGAVLDRLFATIDARRDADPAKSYTAALLTAGAERCAKKVGEEAVETALAGAAGSREALIAESADLLYHLLVLWASRAVTPAEVFAALGGREGRSGHEEKAGRGDTC